MICDYHMYDGFRLDVYLSMVIVKAFSSYPKRQKKISRAVQTFNMTQPILMYFPPVITVLKAALE